MIFVSKKNSRFHRLIGWLTRPIMKDRWMRYIWNAWGETIYVPSSVDMAKPGWERGQAPMIEHEMVHVRQMRALKSPWVFGVLYALLPLPIGLAYFRWRFEREAMLENIRAHAPGINRDKNIEFYAAQVSGSWYFWAWPRSWAMRWFQKNA